MPRMIYKCDNPVCFFIDESRVKVLVHEISCGHNKENRMCPTCKKSIRDPESGNYLACIDHDRYDFAEIDYDNDNYIEEDYGYEVSNFEACCLIWEPKELK